ncbi:MAG: hypothetical protein H7235_00475 [Bdellovibrionaceae bacterium]|nr:hypothetical protein [Pseudobdellovibrionaceae bacterium]
MKVIILTLAMTFSLTSFAQHSKCEQIAAIAGSTPDASVVSLSTYGRVNLSEIIFGILGKKSTKVGSLNVETAGVSETDSEVTYQVHTTYRLSKNEVRPVSNYLVTLAKKDCLIQSLVRQK